MDKKGVCIAIMAVSLVSLVTGCIGDSSSAGSVPSQVCGTHTETYTSSALGCDGMSNCRCLHKQYFGVGDCDSCECTRQVSNC